MRWRRTFWDGSGCRNGMADMKNLRYDNEQCQSVAYEKATPELLRQLRRVAVERRPECCLGCGFEHGCSVHGCAAVRKAIDILEE